MMTEPTLTLPMVEYLQWSDNYHCHAEYLSAVMQCLPNLTTIHHHAKGVVLVNASFTPKMKVLVTSARPDDYRPPQFIGCCSQLQELRMEHFPLTAALADQILTFCPHLKLLEVAVRDMDCDNLLRLLQTLLSLEELIARGLQQTTVAQSNLAMKVAAFPNIKRLTLSGSSDLFRVDVESFIAYLHQCPELEYLSANNFTYSRTQRMLDLPDLHRLGIPSVEQLSRILNSCGVLEALAWRAAWVKCDMAALLVDKLGITLKSLTVQMHYEPALNMLLRHCGSYLTSLDLKCIRLRSGHLEIVTDLESKSCETGFHIVFATCTKLKKVLLEFDRDVVDLPLQAIIAGKLRLSLLELVGKISESEIEWFRQQIRAQQLLPIPKIIIRKSS